MSNEANRPGVDYGDAFKRVRGIVLVNTFYYALSCFVIKLRYRLCAIIFLTICSATLGAPFDNGDAKNGDLLHAESCSSCHNSMFPDGTGNEIYDRDLRKIKSSKSLYAMVEFCANNNGLAWFEEEITDVSKYLNQRFYDFEN